LRRETLKEEFTSLMTLYRLNVTMPSKGPVGANGVTGRQKFDKLTRQHLCHQTCILIRETCRNDFKEFGYDPLSCGCKSSRTVLPNNESVQDQYMIKLPEILDPTMIPNPSPTRLLINGTIELR
jgi:hypothetical protein